MNLSAEAVPCLSEVSASDKRWGPPPPVTDRPASWRLRPQSNHATRKKRGRPALCSWSVTLRAQGGGGGLAAEWRKAFCFHAGSLHAGSLGAQDACAAAESGGRAGSGGIQQRNKSRNAI